MPRAIARWNPERDLWETDQIDLLSGHSDVFSETFPRSGMTRAGTLFEPPTSGHHTDDSASSSLLPTPAAYDGERGGPQSPKKRQAGGHSVTLQDVACFLPPEPPTALRADPTSEVRPAI